MAQKKNACDEGGKSRMNLGGWIFLIASWGFIILLTIYCFYKVLFTKEGLR